MLLTNQTTLLQEWLNTGLASTERLIHLHSVAGTSFFKNLGTELTCRFGIKQIAGLHKSLKSIGIQNTGPNVAVVAGRITAGENVLKVGRTVTEINFIQSEEHTSELQHVRISYAVFCLKKKKKKKKKQ